MVTGCSSGIGLATARMLKARGWTVLPTARKVADLERLRAEGFHAVELDVADGASVQRAADEALRVFDGKIGAVVNNAGFGQPGAMEDLTRDAIRHQFEVNVFGLQQLTNAFVPGLRRQGFGRIVNISSVLGRITIPFMGIYCASKYAVEAMSDVLRVELRGSGVWVAIVEPGPIDTAFTVNSTERARSQIGNVQSHFDAEYRRRISGQPAPKKASDAFRRPPEAVARRIAHALESSHPRRRYPVTAVAWAGWFFRRFMPDFAMDWLVSGRLR